AVRLAGGVDDLLEIGPEREHLGGHGATDQDPIRMRAQPAALELEAIAVAIQDRPRLLARDPCHALEEVIRHVRPAVEEAAERIARRERDDRLARVDDLHGQTTRPGLRIPSGSSAVLIAR